MIVVERVIDVAQSEKLMTVFTSTMSNLLQTGDDGLSDPSYNYDNVKRWDKRLRRKYKILGVREIFVPINHRRAHWLLLRANTVERTITLWDSQGVKEGNQLYLRTMLQYLGDKYRETHGSRTGSTLHYRTAMKRCFFISQSTYICPADNQS